MIEHLLLKLEHLVTAAPAIGIGASFLAGILSSLSPCVYPLIPITIGIIGAAAVHSRAKGFALSFLFTLGVATTYTILGIIAATFGILMSRSFIHPVTLLLLALLYVLLGLSMLGVIRFNLAFFGTAQQPKGGLGAIFILGLISSVGLIPCNAPILGAILGIISLKKNVWYGATALFFYSLGYGFIILVLGTFSSLIRKLPKQGLWLLAIHRVLGGLLIATGGYFILKFMETIR